MKLLDKNHRSGLLFLSVIGAEEHVTAKLAEIDLVKRELDRSKQCIIEQEREIVVFYFHGRNR